MPKNCPICDSPVVNEFKDRVAPRAFGLEKTCNKKPDHLFFCATKKADDLEANIVSITINRTRTLAATWNIPEKKLWISSGSPSSKIFIPYIEPDLSDYGKLCKKLRTYLIFA